MSGFFSTGPVISNVNASIATWACYQNGTPVHIDKVRFAVE